ncbi:LD-carboxypeptidase [Flavihumibacter sp. ZG627]|uniref:S66 peptidase family protein n=1 Tax=Flavihumibacter sp. ZG627 TaxID=1463156 RepID=UPI00057F5C01|nr:LD-carboxypeptidase [Flavihumibacter sp. ZG627]KIC92553.1 peptidase S66 [Flavihumibacter sp. ZG627]
MRIPPYLKKGDTIGMVCPAGYMPPEKWQTAVDVLQQEGYSIRLGTTMNSKSENYFSGTDAERLADLQAMLDDSSVKAIFCGRGGYGMGRIIDQLQFKNFRKHPKWIIGFSDITVLHAHVNRQLKIASLHAPMAAAFNEGEYANPYVQSLLAAVRGEKSVYRKAPHPYDKKGKASGRLVGGNLALVSHLIGTRSAYKTKDRILFLEDVGEQLYNIDRMMIQLKRSGMLENLSALILGGFTDNKDTDRPFGKDIEDIFKDLLDEYDYPICYGFPVSHDKENYALKVGVNHTLIVNEEGSILSEK